MLSWRRGSRAVRFDVGMKYLTFSFPCSDDKVKSIKKLKNVSRILQEVRDGNLNRERSVLALGSQILKKYCPKCLIPIMVLIPFKLLYPIKRCLTASL